MTPTLQTQIEIAMLVRKNAGSGCDSSRYSERSSIRCCKVCELDCYPGVSHSMRLASAERFIASIDPTILLEILL